MGLAPIGMPGLKPGGGGRDLGGALVMGGGKLKKLLDKSSGGMGSARSKIQ